MWRHDIIKNEQVRKHQEKKIDTTKRHLYLDCSCLFCNFLFVLVVMSNEYVDVCPSISK